MGVIWAINPRGKKKKKTKSKSKKKATTRGAAASKRRKGGSGMAKKKPKKRRTNPRKTTTIAKSGAKRAAATIMGMNVPRALANQPAIAFGMFSAKWAAKKFSDTGGDREDWDTKAYIFGALGSVVAGAIAQTIKPGSGQKVFEAGIGLMTYKLIENELIIGRGGWLEEQFGEENEINPEYLEGEEDVDWSKADLLFGENGEVYQKDEGGRWLPMGIGRDPTVAPSPWLGREGERTVSVSPEMGRAPDPAYVQAFLGQSDEAAAERKRKAWFG